MYFRFYKAVSAVLAILVLLVVLFLLSADSYKVLSSIPLSKFVTGRWSPSSGEYNLLPMAVGGLAASMGALLIVSPLSVFGAMALQLFSPRSLASAVRKIFELMSGIPSVIFGLWGLGVLVPLIGEWTPPGASLLAAILVLSLMVLPSTILLVSQALNEVPKDQKAASFALSLSLASQIRAVIFPFVFTRVVSVLCLQFARTLGETMAVVMVAGNIPSWPTSIFDPIRTLTGHIALEMPYAEGLHRSSLMLSGLLLCLPSLILFYLARSYLESRRSL
jgi:phosphate transport system permease protein